MPPDFYVGADCWTQDLVTVWQQTELFAQPLVSEASFCKHPVPRCRLPPELFEQLQMLLEPSSVTGNDWRRLASHMGLCGMKIR